MQIDRVRAIQVDTRPHTGRSANTDLPRALGQQRTGNGSPAKEQPWGRQECPNLNSTKALKTVQAYSNGKITRTLNGREERLVQNSVPCLVYYNDKAISLLQVPLEQRGTRATQEAMS